MPDVSVISKRQELYYVRWEEALDDIFIVAIDIEMSYAAYDVNVIRPKQMLDLAAKRFLVSSDIQERFKRPRRVKYVFFCLLISKVSN